MVASELGNKMYKLKGSIIILGYMYIFLYSTLSKSHLSERPNPIELNLFLLYIKYYQVLGKNESSN